MSDKSAAKQTVRIATFNILAPCYNWLSGWWDRSESSNPNLYLPRFRAIIDLISKQKPSVDIICLQEFWFHGDVMELFDSQFEEKYRIVKLKRTGFKTDGLAILIDRSISILSICPIRFNDMNRRVALLVHLLLPNEQESQIKRVKNEIESYQQKNNVENVPVVLAGDFNGCPEDEVYGFVVENGFMSSYKTVHCKEPHVTHKLYSGEQILVDYIFYRNPPQCQLVPKKSMVLPAEFTDEEWPKEFTLSDHRMIMTEFELETKQEDQPETQTSGEQLDDGTV
ncbi:putative calcium-binding protein [Stylophora pistillata]|uniref:Putative calcium-binding protein n=1 Tax=Stylophora pistillata TaxID=50429 RepID=A0A2B4SW18_STYPI|nr:putative calcium-binding protein [Stylophora pistillata]